MGARRRVGWVGARAIGGGIYLSLASGCPAAISLTAAQQGFAANGAAMEAYASGSGWAMESGRWAPEVPVSASAPQALQSPGDFLRAAVRRSLQVTALRIVAAKRDELGEIEAQRAQAAHVGTEAQAASLPGGPAAKVRRVR